MSDGINSVRDDFFSVFYDNNNNNNVVIHTGGSGLTATIQLVAGGHRTT